MQKIEQIDLEEKVSSKIHRARVKYLILLALILLGALYFVYLVYNSGLFNFAVFFLLVAFYGAAYNSRKEKEKEIIKIIRENKERPLEEVLSIPEISNFFLESV